MRIYKLAIALLGVLCVVIVVVSFMIGGTPVSQRLINLDRTRINDFQQINYAIENYYRDAQKLPSSLDEIRIVSGSLTDPETKKEYEYRIVNESTYQLCTVFSTDTKDTGNYDTTTTYIANNTDHLKGFDCIEYEIPRYLITPTPTPNFFYRESNFATPSPTNTSFIVSPTPFERPPKAIQ